MISFVSKGKHSQVVSLVRVFNFSEHTCLSKTQTAYNKFKKCKGQQTGTAYGKYENLKGEHQGTEPSVMSSCPLVYIISAVLTTSHLKKYKYKTGHEHGVRIDRRLQRRNDVHARFAKTAQLALHCP